MSEAKDSGNFELVPRPPAALERAEPGAGRIIVDMVAEVLVIARREASELDKTYQQGLEYEKRGDQNKAFDFYKAAAEQGHLWAQYKLGECYLRGVDSEGNESEGIAWLEKALDRGLGGAGFVLGNHFCHTLLPNYHEALKYFQRAVDLGDQRSIQNLAIVQEKLGKARETSETDAAQRAAEMGDSNACLEMGTRCLEGVGVPQSAMEAFRWFREAAEQGDNADAWCYMGFMLEAGQGVPANFTEAVNCLRRASALGSDVAYSRLIELNITN